MSRLKSTDVFKAVTRPTYVSQLGLPTWAALLLVGLCLLTLLLVHNWRWWLFLFPAWALLGLVIRTIVRRDHNAMRRLLLGLWSKFVGADNHIWKGTAFTSLPSRPGKTLRGVRAPH